ncbi:MAG: hydrolase [Acidimicrobiales bacterium]
MSTYFTSDHHFGHTNIIAYCGRPFHNVGEMNAAMIVNWNSTVGPADTVHHLGDLVMGHQEDSLSLVGLLNGHIVLHAGNHDGCWHGHGKKGLRLEQDYLDAGIEEIRQGPEHMIVGGREVLVCHFPYRDIGRGAERYETFRPVDEDLWLLHGHVHERWQRRDRMINVGVDVWDFTPVAEETLAEMINGDGVTVSAGGTTDVHSPAV